MLHAIDDEFLFGRINSSAARASQIATWIRHVIKGHLSYIIAAPSMKASLASLFQSLNERQSSYTHLLGLAGRLELLTSHIKAMKNKDDASPTDYYNDPNVVHISDTADDVERISLIPDDLEEGINGTADMDEDYMSMDEDDESSQSD